MRISPPGLLVLFLVAAPLARADEVATPTADAMESARARWEASPDDIEAGVLLQDVMSKQGEERKVVTLFRRAANSQPELKGLAFLYGRALGGRDGIRRMRKALDSGLDGPDVPAAQRIAAWRVLRDVLIDARDFEAAEPAARNAVRLASKAHDWTLLGWILERRDDLEGAAMAYGLAIERNEEHLWARNALALLRAKQGDQDKALKLASDTAERFPDAASAHLHLGLVASLAGDHEAGKAAYAKALTCASRDADTLVAVATAYVDLEDYELAEKALARALAVDPDNPRALVTAAVLALDREHLEDAASLLSRAVKASPRDGRAWYLLGLCRQREGKSPAAIRAYRKACRVEPDSVAYQVALALAHAESGSVDAGISALRRTIQAAPLRADLHLQLGFLQMKRKKYRDAVRSLGHVADLAPEDPRPHFYLAIIYGDHLGKRADARRALEAYVELGGKEPAALRWLEQMRADD